MGEEVFIPIESGPRDREEGKRKEAERESFGILGCQLDARSLIP